jgi:sec-independent protein translocase protein TatC
MGVAMLRMPKFKRKPAPPDGQMELVEHLAELRVRIFRSLAYIAVGMILTYNLIPRFYDVLTRPLEPILTRLHGSLVFGGIAQGFLVWMQVCFVSGIVLAFPFVILELWGFIEPALTPEERKPVVYLAPFSVLLFLAGVGTGYACLPATFNWMGSYLDDIHGVKLLQDAQQYILLAVKIMLAFGIAFQLPMVLLFLGRVGIINADLMTKYWRHATVGISVIAAVLTPSNDPLTMLMMAVPMAGLYLLSIGLVRAFEPRADGTRSLSLATMLLVALAPVSILIAVGYWLWRNHGA